MVSSGKVKQDTETKVPTEDETEQVLDTDEALIDPPEDKEDEDDEDEKISTWKIATHVSNDVYDILKDTTKWLGTSIAESLRQAIIEWLERKLASVDKMIKTLTKMKKIGPRRSRES